jgi:hypothetical protein
MDTELRPLSLGEILDRTFQIYRSRFLLFSGIAVVAATIRLVFGAALVGLTQALAGSSHRLALQLTTGVGSLVTAGISWIAAGLTFAALTFAVEQIYLDRPTTVSAAYQGVRRKLWRYVVLNLACFLLPFLPFVLIGVLAAVSIIARAGSFESQGAGAIAGVVGIGAVFFLVSLPLCLWLASRYALANAAAISESLPVGAALKRSAHLSVGTRGRIILAAVCIAVVQFCLGLLLISPLFPVLARSAGHPPLWITLYQMVFGFISSVLFTPIYGIVLALFYYDARIRKEGFDVEWLLERSGAALPHGELGEAEALPG